MLGVKEFLTAVAGPAVSFVLSFLGICGLAICSSEGSLWSAFLFVVGDVLGSFGLHGLASGDFFVTRSLAWLAGPLFYLAAMNAMLGFFNRNSCEGLRGRAMSDAQPPSRESVMSCVR